jgi:hypothetical protein
MACPPQIQASTLDRLSNDVLHLILDLAMARNSPFYVDDPHLGQDQGTSGSDRPPRHDRALQPVHRMDWIAINSTCRRIRALGKKSFFTMKTFPYIRDVIIVNAKQAAPRGFLTLPRTLAAFPCLRSCTLLFRFPTRDQKGDGSDVEWITVAFVAGRPVSPKMRDHMTRIGLPENHRLEEALGHKLSWQEHANEMEGNVYPILQVKCNLLQAKRERERQAAS